MGLIKKIKKPNTATKGIILKNKEIIYTSKSQKAINVLTIKTNMMNGT